MQSVAAHGAGPAMVLVAAVVMAAWTWNTWPDVLVDFGKELYIAWRLSAGDHLYGDVAYYMGPLSPEVNGLLFAAFGVGLRTLVIANLCVAAAVTALLMHLATVAAGRGAAVVAGLTFVLIFAFNQYTPNGNYNFVCPYEHEYTHGLMISLATLAALWRAMSTKRTLWFFIAGLGCGLVALTRAEVLIAIGGAVGLGALLCRPRGWAWAALVASVGAPSWVALALLGWHLPMHAALLAVAGSWPSMFSRELTSLPFYRRGMGLLDPVRSIRLLIVGTLQWAGWLAPAVLMGVIFRPGNRPAAARTIYFTAFAVYALATAVMWRSISTDFFRPLTVCMIVWMLVAARSWWEHRSVVAAFRLTLSVFAALLLLKMVLYARIHQYGFAIAMPATILTAVGLCIVLPKALDERGRGGGIVRSAMLGSGGVLVMIYLSLSNAVVRTKTVQVGAESDVFWADATRGPAVNECLADLSGRTAPGQTVLVLPEGAMLNYLARRAEPTPYANFNPPDLAIFGARRTLAAIKTHPADVVVVAHKDTSEFGVRFFGRDYGQNIAEWVRANYRLVRVIGATPMRDKRFGIAVYEPVKN